LACEIGGNSSRSTSVILDLNVYAIGAPHGLREDFGISDSVIFQLPAWLNQILAGDGSGCNGPATYITDDPGFLRTGERDAASTMHGES
jgi:hypothetical protein